MKKLKINRGIEKRLKKIDKLSQKIHRYFEAEDIHISGAVPAKIGKSGIGKFIKSTGSRLQKLVDEEVLSDESLHAIRKLLKDMLYCWSYIKADLALSKTFLSKKDIRRIVDLLGDYRDIFMGIVQLDSDYIYIEDEREHVLLLNIRTKWLQKKNEIKRQISTELPKLKIDLGVLKEELL